jgi:hypothetical protein
MVRVNSSALAPHYGRQSDSNAGRKRCVTAQSGLNLYSVTFAFQVTDVKIYSGV